MNRIIKKLSIRRSIFQEFNKNKSFDNIYNYIYRYAYRYYYKYSSSI